MAGSDRPLLLVYADNGDTDRGLEGLEILDLIATPIGLALENEVLRRSLRNIADEKKDEIKNRA